MSDIPLTHSDVQCEVCLEYFRFEGDLIDHRDREHGIKEPPMSADVVHLMAGHANGDGTVTVTSIISLCCKVAFPTGLGTIEPEAVTCSSFTPEPHDWRERGDAGAIGTGISPMRGRQDTTTDGDGTEDPSTPPRWTPRHHALMAEPWWCPIHDAPCEGCHCPKPSAARSPSQES